MAGKRELVLFQVEVDDDGPLPETGCAGRLECPDPDITEGDSIGGDFLAIHNPQLLNHVLSQVQGAYALNEELLERGMEMVEVPPWLIEMVVIGAYSAKDAVKLLRERELGRLVEVVA